METRVAITCLFDACLIVELIIFMFGNWPSDRCIAREVIYVSADTFTKFKASKRIAKNFPLTALAAPVLSQRNEMYCIYIKWSQMLMHDSAADRVTAAAPRA